MKILHIISGDVFGGAETQVLQTLLALKKRPEHIQCHCILFNRGLLEQKLKNAGISIYVVHENNFNLLNIIGKVALLLLSIKPELIHVHRAKEHLVAFFSQFCTFKFRPIIRTVHGLSSKSSQKNPFKKLLWLLIIRFDRLLIHFLSDSVIAVSQDMYQYLSTIMAKPRIVKIYNSVNVSDYTFSNSNEIIRKTRNRYSIFHRFWIGSAARLVYPKNQNLFIKTAAAINSIYPGKFRFSIFGDGPLKKDLQSKILELNLSDIFTLHGFEQNITPVIASFDLFLLCSFHEGLPMALLEAMALGKPVICTAVGGIKEVITSYQNGILIPSDNSSALADAIKLLYNHQSLRKTIADNARKHIQNYFSIENATVNLLKLYQDCTGGSFYDY